MLLFYNYTRSSYEVTFSSAVASTNVTTLDLTEFKLNLRY